MYLNKFIHSLLKYFPYNILASRSWAELSLSVLFLGNSSPTGKKYRRDIVLHDFWGQFEFYRAFLGRKLVGNKCGKIQIVEEIVQNNVFLYLIPYSTKTKFYI